MISCYIPNICSNELKYTVKYVFSRLVDHQIIFYETLDEKVTISLDNTNEISFEIPFFKLAHRDWLGLCTLPTNSQVYTYQNFNKGELSSIPVIYGNPNILFSNQKIHSEIDIFGTIFFLLSRYEEGIVNCTLDEHDRFPATSSVAFKFGFLERPLVDEYIELFYTLFHSLWPNINKKKQSFRKFITCDVDWPFEPIRQTFKSTILATLGDLIKRKNVLSALNRWGALCTCKLNIPFKDGFRDNISWIMDENEEQGNRVAFYFITETTNKKFDSANNFDSKKMRSLFKEIHFRGHEIGLHPGYECFNNDDNFARSANTLKRVLKEEGIKQEIIGGRMHFLRWDALRTPKLWDDNGFDYDSSLSFADRAGFRCGTCHPFPMYDLINRNPLAVWQRPLINMESTIIADRYEGFGYGMNTLNRFLSFRSKVEQYKGEYVLLWHNTHFDNQKDKFIYKELI